MCMCVHSENVVGVVIDLHLADQLSHKLLQSLRTLTSDLQDTLMVHAVHVFVALHHLNQSISQSVNFFLAWLILKHHLRAVYSQSVNDQSSYLVSWSVCYLVGDQREAEDSQPTMSRHDNLRSCTHTCKHTTGSQQCFCLHRWQTVKIISRWM